MMTVEPIPSRSHSQSQYTSRYSTKAPVNKSQSTHNTSQPAQQRSGRRHSTLSLSSTRSTSRERPKKYVGDYCLGRTLGKGASDKAVKREIAIMKLIHHPSIMALHDVIEDDESPELYLILEYMEGGELFEYLVSEGRLPEKKARSYFQQIIYGVDYCHKHLICHRDLKPENLLLDRNLDIKIADFGMASLQPIGSLLETSCGSPHYASPEIVTGRPYDGSSSDIWSCGIILYALLTGHLPFDDENIRLLLKKVKTGRYVMPHDISYQAQDLIRKILVTDPAKRITTEQIKRHPWFAQDIPPKIAQMPEPPSSQEIDRPVKDISQIDDRIVETIKFLWGEEKTEAVVEALMGKEHNMQKVTYVLLRRHAEKYWESRHDDDDESYIVTLWKHPQDTSSRRYSSMSNMSRRRMSMHAEFTSSTDGLAPQGFKPDARRRSSPSTYRRASIGPAEAARQYPLIHPMELPPSPVPSPRIRSKSGTSRGEINSSQIRIDMEAYSGRRHSTKETSRRFDAKGIPPSPKPAKSLHNLFSVATLGKKNPFAGMLSDDPNGKGRERQRRNTQPHQEAINNEKSTAEQRKRLHRLSMPMLDIGSIGFDRKSINFSLRRKEASVWKEMASPTTSVMTPPISPSPPTSPSPVRSKSGARNNLSQDIFFPVPPPSKSPTGTGYITPPSSHGSSANELTKTTSSAGQPIDDATKAANKIPWLQNLFFFKQPKILSVTCEALDCHQALRKVQDAMREGMEAKLQSKPDKDGHTRYRGELRIFYAEKNCKVKFKLEFIVCGLIDGHRKLFRVDFIQQQGDALALAAATKNIQQAIDRRGSSSTSGFSWSTSTTEDNPSAFHEKLKFN
ncbi:hypothetical protein NQZ79_g7748 [Umbelopsis isabellina]|nr:hypothetical protein NQZ79_g7748 [Umbelopsis isabellina]